MQTAEQRRLRRRKKTVSYRLRQIEAFASVAGTLASLAREDMRDFQSRLDDFNSRLDVFERVLSDIRRALARIEAANADQEEARW